jgi:hypothetical protein
VNQHPFSVGQKVLCVFADFGDEVREDYVRLPEENCAYTVSEVYWGEDDTTEQTLASVKLLEVEPHRHRSGGFPAWQFRLLEEGAGSLSPPVAGGNPDESAAAAISHAADPTTEPALLALLSRDGPPSLGWMLATNPNTPGVVLHKLWKTHPLAVLENPLLAYQTLSTGRSLCKMLPLDVKLVLYAALRSDGRIEEMEAHLPLKERCDWSYQCGYEDSCDQEILAAVAPLLVMDPAPAVKEAMANYFDLSFLGPLTGDPVVKIRVIVAKRAGSTREGTEALMDILACDPEEEVRKALAGCSYLTAATHERLGADPSAAVREILAKRHQERPDIGETGWRSLLSDGGTLCLLVAENTSCHESVRMDLTCHHSPEVRHAAWKGFQFGRSQLGDRLEEQLDVVFNDPKREDERLALTGNITVTGPLIKRLLQCSEKVTRALAANDRIPITEREQILRHHDDETVAIAIARIHGDHSDLINVGFSHPSARVRAVVAGISGRQAAQLRPKLAMDPSFPVRLSVCSYLVNRISSYDGPGIREALEILSRDPVAKIRALVVRDRRLPQKNLSHLFGDKSVRVRLQVLEHRCYGSRQDLGMLDHKVVGVRVEAAKLIMENQRGATTLEEGKRTESADPLPDARIAADASPLVRVVAAESGNTSLPVLKLLIADKDPEVQRALTQRSKKSVRRPADVMRKLEASRNPYERAKATGIYGAGKRRLHRLAADRCWYVRAMTAKYGHKVDLALLKTLAGDPHPMVRECALRRLKASGAMLAGTEGGLP